MWHVMYVDDLYRVACAHTARVKYSATKIRSYLDNSPIVEARKTKKGEHRYIDTHIQVSTTLCKDGS